MGRTILHVDMDAFFASVEQHDNPELRGRPVIVGGTPAERGVVAAASYEARRSGVRSAMPTGEALRLCPDAVLVPPNGERYAEVSRHILAVMERFTPRIEPLSIDEAFLDVSAAGRLFGSGEETARRLKREIHEETGLTASIGVAPNKFLAKVASEINKPDGLTVVPDSRAAILAFLARLPVGRLWGVGKVTMRRLDEAGLRTIGDIQSSSENVLAGIVGRHQARHFMLLARGEDESEVEAASEARSISREHTFPTDISNRAELTTVLLDLVEDVGRSLRAAGMRAAVAHIKLRWKDFVTITRQCRLGRGGCCDDFSLREAAQRLFDLEELVKPVRLIGFGVSGLSDGGEEQLPLFPVATAPDKREKLSRVVDVIRDKHGADSIGRADAVLPPGPAVRHGGARRGGREDSPSTPPRPWRRGGPFPPGPRQKS